MFTVTDFSHLKFLDGRWVGKGPDGSEFYEQYSFPSDREMRSVRYADKTFSTPTDDSAVALQNGQITSIWREFTWEASDVSPGKACFTPVEAPSSFCWEQASDNEVHVTQRWLDDSGATQQYVVQLRRL